MKEKFPLHIMIKPEGLEHFPDYIRNGLALFEREADAEIVFRIRTTLTPEQVHLVYPENVPDELRSALSSQETEHHILHGTEEIYEMAKKLKGKMNMSSGMRSALKAMADEQGLSFERWQNFIHTADSIEESRHICNSLIDSRKACAFCAIRVRCAAEGGWQLKD